MKSKGPRSIQGIGLKANLETICNTSTRGQSHRWAGYLQGRSEVHPGTEIEVETPTPATKLKPGPITLG